jgi:hypothetical protein
LGATDLVDKWEELEEEGDMLVVDNNWIMPVEVGHIHLHILTNIRHRHRRVEHAGLVWQGHS